MMNDPNTAREGWYYHVATQRPAYVFWRESAWIARFVWHDLDETSPQNRGSGLCFEDQHLNHRMQLQLVTLDRGMDMSLLMRYQEAHTTIENLSMAVSDAVHSFDQFGADFLGKYEEPLRFSFGSDDMPRAQLKQAMLEAFEYLRWHCERCGNLLENREGAPVGHSAGNYRGTLCEPCYNELNGWLSEG